MRLTDEMGLFDIDEWEALERDALAAQEEAEERVRRMITYRRADDGTLTQIDADTEPAPDLDVQINTDPAIYANRLTEAADEISRVVHYGRLTEGEVSDAAAVYIQGLGYKVAAALLSVVGTSLRIDPDELAHRICKMVDTYEALTER